jgi:hypothetical protein
MSNGTERRVSYMDSSVLWSAVGDECDGDGVHCEWVSYKIDVNLPACAEVWGCRCVCHEGGKGLRHWKGCRGDGCIGS